MHLFKTRMRTLIRNRTVLFWSLVFPLVLATFFNLAFKNIMNDENFSTIDLAVIDSEEKDVVFLNTIENIQINEDTKMFNVNLVADTEAYKLLENNDVAAIIESSGKSIKLILNSSGLDQTITKSVIDEYLQTNSAVIELIVLSENNVDEIMTDLMTEVNYIDEISASKNRANIILIFFFSLIGMALIYGGFWGTDNIINLQANMSTKAIRVAVSPVNRLKILIIYTISAFLIHIFTIAILMFYLLVVLGLNFGDKLLLTFLICILGSLVGISFGSFITISLKKAREGVKVMITTLVGVIGGFLSGMMVVEMKYIIQTKAPFLHYINPVSIITDALHTLNYFGPTPRFYLNIGIMVLMILVFTFGTYLFYRRDSYESI